MVFSSFVRLDWRDMSETKSRFSGQNGQGRPAVQRGEAAQAQRGSEPP